ncbi:oligosaccharide flippase family protein [Alteromonas stellipolaris]|uniref:oligosaccharide flippase family protein n=1 Tax=Alteromonas stellipolaris TaxID=233316 RepID=UPI0021179139|nr:oligosaccharide flippase family protein [Alteromonas stellipolaris]MCQ8847335.1 oligosaccharide flippase family protein [Alteromonas stellipolaris]
MSNISLSKLKSLMLSDTTKSRALRGSIWVVGGHALSQGLRLLSNLILTRLLFPEIFGIMAIIQVIIQGLVMVSDLGLVPSIVRSKNTEDSRFLNTAWTIQFARNALLWVMTLAISFPIANFYERPELTYLIPLAAISLLVNGLFPIKVILASRSMNLFRVTAFQILGQFSGSVVSIVLAFYYQNAIIFVAGALFSEILRLFLNMYFLPGINNKFEWHRPSVRELFSFGKWIFVASVFGFAAQHANVFILGKILPADVFGIYTVALVLAMLPITVCNMLNGKVLMPLFSEMDRKGSTIEAIQKARYVVLGGASAVTLVIMIISPFFFSVLYDERYSLAGYISLLILMVSLPELMLIVTLNKLMVEGRSKLYAALKMFRAVALVSIGILLSNKYGIVGLCVATLISGIFTYILAIRARGMAELIIIRSEAVIFLSFITVSVLSGYFYFDGVSQVLHIAD